jgi:hypothetical protein
VKYVIEVELAEENMTATTEDAISMERIVIHDVVRRALLDEFGGPVLQNITVSSIDETV